LHQVLDGPCHVYPPLIYHREASHSKYSKTLYFAHTLSFSSYFFNINPNICIKKRLMKREKVWGLVLEDVTIIDLP
jgi:hypothetical protein